MEPARTFYNFSIFQPIVIHSSSLPPGPIRVYHAPYMADLTTDPSDPRLHKGSDTEETPQHDVYLVLSKEERAKGFIRPYRDAYRHKTCNSVTTMGRELSETYARDPYFYGSTYCLACKKHLPVGEFTWLEMNGDEKDLVGS